MITLITGIFTGSLLAKAHGMGEQDWLIALIGFPLLLGASHLAVALKTPTVAIYTATDPGLTGLLVSGYHRNLGGKGQMPSPDAVLEALRQVLG